jgi:hypothetical protein
MWSTRFAHCAKRVDHRFAMLDQIIVSGTEKDFHIPLHTHFLHDPSKPNTPNAG